MIEYFRKLFHKPTKLKFKLATTQSPLYFLISISGKDIFITKNIWDIFDVLHYSKLITRLDKWN